MVLPPVALMLRDETSSTDRCQRGCFIPFLERNLRDESADFSGSDYISNGDEPELDEADGAEGNDSSLWRFNYELQESEKLAELLNDHSPILASPLGIEGADSYLLVSQDELEALSATRFELLREQGWLPYLYAHIASLQHLYDLQQLLEMQSSHHNKSNLDTNFGNIPAWEGEMALDLDSMQEIIIQPSPILYNPSTISGYFYGQQPEQQKINALCQLESGSRC